MPGSTFLVHTRIRITTTTTATTTVIATAIKCPARSHRRSRIGGAGESFGGGCTDHAGRDLVFATTIASKYQRICGEHASTFALSAPVTRAWMTLSMCLQLSSAMANAFSLRNPSIPELYITPVPLFDQMGTRSFPWNGFGLILGAGV